MLSPFEQTELTPGYLPDRTLLVSVLTGSLFRFSIWVLSLDQVLLTIALKAV